MKKWVRLVPVLVVPLLMLPSWAAKRVQGEVSASARTTIHGGNLSVEAFDNGFYALRSDSIRGDVLHSDVEADTAEGTLRSAEYPRHLNSITSFSGDFGSGQLLTVTHTGLAGKPDLVCEFRLYGSQPWGDIRVTVRNSTAHNIEVNSIRVVNSKPGTVVELNGPASEDLVLSDRFGEDIPYLRMLGHGNETGGAHLAFGSQLIYNQQSGESLFLGALTADRLLTVLHLQGSGSYAVEDTGTNEALNEQRQQYPPANTVPFRVQAPSQESVSSERLMFAVGPDYHAQLENYGAAVRIIDRGVFPAQTLIGWWSWTAYYSGVTGNAVLTNAAWMAQNLESIGYKYFQVDEGYQYARGEYATPDGKAFPQGVAYVARQAEDEGIKFGLWVAPFQVSDRSWVYEHHRDWLVHNLAGDPIHIGNAVGGQREELYALDPTHPGAQEYLRYTYRTMAKDWGVRFIKMDFMDSSAVEGVYYRPNTTALQALRIGLEIIRSTVGNDVVLDKDGSPMLTPVGVVNTGRISQDTGHTFQATREAALGIAGRYYMNRNFYGADPDAFTVSKQIIPDRLVWHRNTQPLTLDEAEASIALSAVSGGMFEIGDDLPTLGASPERLALVRNADLLDMARLGRAAIPLDLMTYRPEDVQPCIFLLKEDSRQQIIAVFNWTDNARTKTLSLEALGLKPNGTYTATNILRSGAVPFENGRLTIAQAPHSVSVLKLIDTSVPEIVPVFEAHAPAASKVGEAVDFHAIATSQDVPVLGFHWEFGDGVSADGADVVHAYTHGTAFTVTVTATGLNGRTTQKTRNISVTGTMTATYDPALKERYVEPK